VTPDFCPRCGKPTKELVPDPQFCGNCQLLLRVDIEVVVGEPPTPPSVPATYDPYPSLEAGESCKQALDNMLDRHFAVDAPLPLSIGIIIIMGVPIIARRPMHRRNFGEQMADPARRPLPYNLTVNPHSPSPILWYDAKDRAVSRAAALVYYWGSKDMGKKWHFDEPLAWDDEDRLVTTTAEQTIDFELRLKEDMRDEVEGKLNYTRVLDEAFVLLTDIFASGVNTSSRHISPVGAPVGWAIFAMDELDPKHRSTT